MYRNYKVLDTKEITRMHMDGEDRGLLETYNKKDKKWKTDWNKAKMFIGEIDVEIIREEEAMRFVKEE